MAGVGQVENILNEYLNETDIELTRLNKFWCGSVLTQDSYLGEVDFYGLPKPSSIKSAVLSTRMLWFYSESALYELDKNKEESSTYLELRHSADALYQYLERHFLDADYGGIYWAVTENGEPQNTRKQVYAQAFMLYALCAYHKVSGLDSVLSLSRAIFSLIEHYARDRKNGGYFEAFTRDWQDLDDYRLSELDLNSPKTMNTHLHIIEAYTAFITMGSSLCGPLLGVVEEALSALVSDYLRFFMTDNNAYLHMFLDIEMNDESQASSFGHDIESYWLLTEACDALSPQFENSGIAEKIQMLAENSLNHGVAEDGSLLDHYDFQSRQAGGPRLWWVQAEAMVGFLSAWQQTKEIAYLEQSLCCWDFIKDQFVDLEAGEWHWLARADQQPGVAHYKVGFWKGPYHNGRALMEVGRRIRGLLNE